MQSKYFRIDDGLVDITDSYRDNQYEMQLLLRGGGYWTELILHILTHDIIHTDKSIAIFGDVIRLNAWQLIAFAYNITGALTPAVLQTLWDKSANGYSLTYSLTHSLTHSCLLTHSLTHSLHVRCRRHPRNQRKNQHVGLQRKQIMDILGFRPSYVCGQADAAAVLHPDYHRVSRANAVQEVGGGPEVATPIHHSLTHSPTHSLTYSPTHSLTHRKTTECINLFFELCYLVYSSGEADIPVVVDAVSVLLDEVDLWESVEVTITHSLTHSLTHPCLLTHSPILAYSLMLAHSLTHSRIGLYH